MNEVLVLEGLGEMNKMDKETFCGEIPELKIKPPYDSGNKEDLTCCDCERVDDSVQWGILVRRKYRSTFGKKYEPYCTDCVIGELEGVHTGGGLTDRVIQKIYRIRNVSAFIDEEKREKRNKELKKEYNKDNRFLMECLAILFVLIFGIVAGLLL
jgi:hypothetical protein